MKHIFTAHASETAPDFLAPEPFVVTDARLSILAHRNQRNRFDKQREIAQNEREIAAELERMA
jgi:hypothetical protein